MWRWEPPPPIIVRHTIPPLMVLAEQQGERCALCAGPLSTVETIWIVWPNGAPALACDPCGTAAPGGAGEGSA